MENLPITHMTLYKHGVGFFERRGEVHGEEVALSFRVGAMNDILKSLTAIDWSEGQVLGVDYATPKQREELLEGCSVRLGDRRSLRDLLASLRGRRVVVHLDQAEQLSGTLVGLDEPDAAQPLATALVSLLAEDSDAVKTVPLQRVQGVEIVDARGVADLRFFLQTSLMQEAYRQVTIRLTPGEHDLSVSYIAPAPTWRVSYRLVLRGEDSAGDEDPTALLLGWGIFDNQLEEDLEGISLSLMAGMPISFVYDLYIPFTPQRPIAGRAEAQAREAAAPVAFEKAMALDRAPEAGMGVGMGAGIGMMMPSAAPPAMTSEALERATQVSTQGEALGELFQYTIQTPVTVGRGQSAMVPIVSADLAYQKALIYSATKETIHPVATLRLKNETGLALERGPTTVIDQVRGAGVYAGEAILPFTAPGSEIMVSYAVELGCKVKVSKASSYETHSLRMARAYMYFDGWDIQRHTYQLSNSTDTPLTILVEHPRTARYEIFDTITPKERTDNVWRFEVTVPPQGGTTLEVQERRLVHRKEEVRKQSHQALQRYMQQGLMERAVYDRVVKLLMLYDTIEDYEARLKALDVERAKIYEAQTQIQGNMSALSHSGKEGELRTHYVEQLEATEAQLRQLEQQEADLKTAIAQTKADIAARLKALV
jgi:hypothetical protein